KALQAADEGIRRGKEVASPFITAVGYMREGHALMMQGNEEEISKAPARFEQVVEISRELSTPRLRVEAFWGLTRYYGYQGDLESATTLAQKGISIATRAGDEWIASLIRLAMGASYVLAGKIQEASVWLEQSLRGFQECSDPFGASAVRLWQCYGWYRRGEYDVLSQALGDLLATCQQNYYNFLLTKPTLLGFPDNRLGVPLLIWAREQNIGLAYPVRLLAIMGLDEITIHPGYRLMVKVLGQFEVSRGKDVIDHSDWRRAKTRQLFQLLVTSRHAPLDREQICENLWPEADLAGAERNFKVVLNTLYEVLEPDRQPGAESAYVLREGAVYGLRPGADIWIDADQFGAYVREAEKLQESDIDLALENYRKALDLYKGEYLPGARYQVWSAIEREHLAVTYLGAADKYCELSLKRRAYQQVIEDCQRILSYDNCWERAYRYLMTAYDQLGDHGQVARTYQRCKETLQEELNIQPSNETIELFHRLIDSE
ncbi:MAG: bacterial transcriptional activator domain-containing protein, partial [Anaerolineales bacterium]